MSDHNPKETTKKPQTLIGKTFCLPFSILGILCGSLILSILIEWLGIYFLWSDQGWHHAQSMFHHELNQLSTNFTRSILLSNPVQTANTLLSTIYDWLFVKSGLLDQVHAVLTPKSTDSTQKLTFRHYLNSVANHMQSYLLAAAYTTLTFIVRIFVLILSIPLIIMAVFVGLIDGLVKRDVRRFVAGHESGFVYHRAKAFLIPTLTLPWIIYLTLPISVSPLWIMMPCALLAGIVMNITVASFKKYL